MSRIKVLFESWLKWAVPATAQERAAALWSFFYFFSLLAGYYVLRPLRDEMGISGGVDNLPWLFTATFVSLLLIQPLYGYLVAKLPRRRLITTIYHFFVANIALFWLLLTFGISHEIIARVFFVWVGVFNLFAVALFWSFMADLFTAEQGKRLFGFIGAGGTAGGVLGPAITIVLAVPLGPVNLLLVAIVFLEVAIFCVHRLDKTLIAQSGGKAQPQPIGGSPFAGLAELIRSPYLIGIAGWVSLMSFCASFLYYEELNIVAAMVQGEGAQTRIFATIDLGVGLLTLATQLFATGRLIKRFGVGIATAALPGVYLVGFTVLSIAPTLAIVMVLQVIHRWMNFAISNPARQVLFTVVSREEKYKAKNLIDVVISRGSDSMYGWFFESLQMMGLKLGAIALCGLPAAAGWLLLSLGLGKAQENRAKHSWE